MSQYIKVAENEGEEAIEIPCETDSTVYVIIRITYIIISIICFIIVIVSLWNCVIFSLVY